MEKNMLGFGKFIFKKKYMLIVSMLFFALIGYAIISLAINPAKTYYSYKFSSEVQINNYQEIISTENLQRAKEVDSKFNYIKNEYLALKYPTTINYNNEYYEITIKAKIFKTERSAKEYLSVLSSLDNQTAFISIDVLYEINPLIGFAYGVVIGFIMTIIVLGIFYLKEYELVLTYIADNKKIYKTPFSQGYWRLALVEHKKIKNITITTILLSLMIISQLLTLPSGFGILGISFSYIFFAVICLLYGPLVGLLVGFTSDIMGFIINPPAASFNFLYTLNAMLAGLIYGLFLYRTKVTFAKILFTRILINLFVNAFLGSFWWGIVMDFNIEETFIYMFSIAMPKNIVYLLPQSILLFMIIKALMPIMKQANLVDRQICDNVTLI